MDESDQLRSLAEALAEELDHKHHGIAPTTVSASIQSAKRRKSAKLRIVPLYEGEVPPEIGDLTWLEELELWHSITLTELPPEIGHLENLRALRFGYCFSLRTLPVEIGQLEKLRKLQIVACGLRSLPPSFGNLINLRELEISRCDELGSLIPEIGALENLKILTLDRCGLSTLPPEIGNLNSLQQLRIRDNHLEELPTEIGHLANLRSLLLTGNDLRELPPSIRRLKRLRYLTFQRNKSLGIPPELLRRAPRHILAYYFKSQTEETRPLNEAKILIVGEGGVGKTALARRLLNPAEYDEARLEKTRGINIDPWQVAGDSKENSIRVNIWDFGGQEIMHHTHRFFLTKRSLYLLVLDARAGSNERHVHHWMQMIQSYGSDSPVLIVLNKCDQHYLEINERRVKLDYEENVKRFFKVSCRQGTGLEALRREIRKQVQALPHVHDRLPLTYFQVKAELERQAVEQDVIKFSEYEDICRRFRLTRQDSDVLIGFLHDLGTVLNFADEGGDGGLLHSENILNPRWVTRGVYRIINDDHVRKKRGVLHRNQLNNILDHPKYPRERRRFILEMMRKFELCFEFPRSRGRRWLIPELLQESEPDLDWDTGAALNFEYRYEVLPTGLIPHFIVRMHHNLFDRPVYWRSGVILDIEGNQALVRGDTRNERVYVSILGPERRRRSALSAVRDAFRAIHSTFHRPPQEMVPLPDNPRVVIPYTHLVKMEEKGASTYWPAGAEREYSIRFLLDGIEEQNQRQRLGKARGRLKRRVFLSHTSEFAKYPEGWTYLQSALDSVTRAGDIPSDMHYFAARDKRVSDYCREKVEECDIFVGIIGLRFGSQVRDRPDLSYTQLEFEAAADAGLQRFVFLLDPDSPVPPSTFTQPGWWHQQSSFRQELLCGDLSVRTFDSPSTLGMLIYQSLVESKANAET